MDIVKTPIKNIKPNPKNPRTIRNDKYLKLVQSIKDFPDMLKVRPIVYDKDGFVIGGNMRLKACAEAGLKEVWAVSASNLTEEQQKQFIIKDNLNYGDWDYLLLEKSNDLESWGFDIPEWSEDTNITEDDIFDDLVSDWHSKSWESESSSSNETFPDKAQEASYIILVLEEQDFLFYKKNEKEVLRITNTENISDAFLKMLKDNYENKN